MAGARRAGAPGRRLAWLAVGVLAVRIALGAAPTGGHPRALAEALVGPERPASDAAQGPGEPEGLDPAERRLAAIYRRVAPGVVSIVGTRGAASGFVIDGRGYLVTNHHVVLGSASVQVTFAGGKVAEARVVGVDPDSDVAVLKVDALPEGVHALELGDSDRLVVGQRAVAIGNPYGLSGTMTVGIVSGLHRSIPAALRPFRIPDAIQTDAVINPGNSGGPLVDSAGRVIGVTTATVSEDGRYTGVGFAIPINLVKRVAFALIEHGSYAWPWLGISGRDVTPELQAANGLPVERGAYVDEVFPGGPAEKAGLRGTQGTSGDEPHAWPVGGDVIVAIDGHPVERFEDVLAFLARHGEVGQVVHLTVVRDGQLLVLPVVLEARPGSGQ